jgi:hypothetical protein
MNGEPWSGLRRQGPVPLVKRFDPGARTRELRAVNIALEKLRVLWRIVHGQQWISAAQLLFVAARLDEIGRMAGGWMKAEKPRSP